jgi:hypothetical protein
VSALTLQRTPEPVRSAANPPSAAAHVVVQRASTFGPSSPVAAAPITDAGGPLDSATRTEMETGFGRDFGDIRVHDDARAHDQARSLGARAYTAGDHIVFGEGAYRPETPRGQALIAHELAHSVQQDGVQMKANGPLPASADGELEAQADRAAQVVIGGGRSPALSTLRRPAVLRSIEDPAASGTAKTPAAGPAQKLPPGMTVIADEPPGVGTTELVVGVTNFVLPAEKGMGPWVKSAYTEAASGGRLVFSPLIEGGRVAAFKEGGEDYKSIWLGNFGFSSTQGLATAFRSAAKTNDEVKTALADKSVGALIRGMDKGLQASGCDIDHIVEKQMGGTSIPTNLQLLDSKKNQASGRDTYQALVKLVESIRDQSMRGTGVRKLQLQLHAVDVAPATTDASFVVEGLLRKGAVVGKEEIKAKAEGEPVSLAAGGVGETVRVLASGVTPIDSMAKRIVPGMRLTTYTRGPGGAKSKSDKVEGELDSRAVSKTGAKSEVLLTAEPAPEGTTIGAGAGGAAAEANTAAAEARVLKLPKTGNKSIAFYYPYLSPGFLDQVALDETGRLYGTGIINPSVPFLPNLHIKFGPGPDVLDLVAPIPADKLKTPIPSFRFTGGELALALSPIFVPKGSLSFEIGPKGKPVVVGEILAKYEGGAFIAIGTLRPGIQLPGIKDASGEVQYHSEQGWSGKLKATSSSIPNATISAELGFTSGKDGGFHPYGSGGLTTKIRESPLFLKVAWHGGPIAYYGGVTIPKPMPLVDKVVLDGAYENELLHLKGDAEIKWRGISSTMHVAYRRKDGDADGKFSGKADVKVALEKATGVISLNFDEEGRFWGGGSITYRLTKDISPKLGVEITKDHKIKVLGEVAIADMALTKMWPAPAGGTLTIIKGVGLKFPVPLPVPGITAFGEIRASAGLRYGVGPVMVKGVVFSGELFPLEDDPQVKARLKGRLVVPAFGEIYGTFGARIGAEVAGGLVGAKGGIDLTPALRIEGEGGLAVDAEYVAGAFSFSAEAFAVGRLLLKLRIDLVAEVYAGYGLWSHEWTWNIKDFQKQVGPELRLTLGKIAYGKNGEITWPSLSQIKLAPESLDPIAIVKDLLDTGKSAGKVVKG